MEKDNKIDISKFSEKPDSSSPYDFRYDEKEGEFYRNKTGLTAEIVSKLSDGECSLSESIELFDEGTKLAGLCNELLNKAEQRIKVISKGNENE